LREQATEVAALPPGEPLDRGWPHHHGTSCGWVEGRAVPDTGAGSFQVIGCFLVLLGFGAVSPLDLAVPGPPPGLTGQAGLPRRRPPPRRWP